MRQSEKVMPVAALVTALSTLACCVPLGITAALGLAGLSAVVEPLQPWLLGLSFAFLAIGLVQLYRSKGTCRRRSRTSIAMFWVAAIVVVVMTLFPQAVAGLIADRFP